MFVSTIRAFDVSSLAGRTREEGREREKKIIKDLYGEKGEKKNGRLQGEDWHF
jgi:hypothetical protein